MVPILLSCFKKLWTFTKLRKIMPQTVELVRISKESRIRLADDSDFSGSEDSNDEEDPDYDEADEYVEELQDVQILSNVHSK